MGRFRKTDKHELKIVPDEKDGTVLYTEQTLDVAGDSGALASATEPEGQLALDVFQTPDEIVVVAPVAGVKKENLTLSINRTDDHDEILQIRGRRDFHFAVEIGDYFTQECFWGNFSRSVILPESVDTTQVKASFRNGVLTVRIPKVERIKTRMIAIGEE